MGNWGLGDLGTLELGNLGTGELGNLGTWELGILGTWEIKNLQPLKTKKKYATSWDKQIVQPLSTKKNPPSPIKSSNSNSRPVLNPDFTLLPKTSNDYFNQWLAEIHQFTNSVLESKGFY